MVAGRLVNMEEASPEAEVSKDVATSDPTPDVQEEDQHDTLIYLFLSLDIHGHALLKYLGNFLFLSSTMF